MAELKYTTPEEFVEYYTERLKEELNVYGVKVSKVGFIGFLMDLLGWTHFDVKKYYDDLFKEAFLATSQKDQNLYIHGEASGYTAQNAKSSQAHGQFSCDFSLLPRMLSTASRREVRLNASDSIPIQFSLDGRNFICEANYTFILEQDEFGNKYHSAVIEREDLIEHIPSVSASIESEPMIVEIKDTHQYEKLEYLVTLPDYAFGSSYSYEFDIGESNFIKDIEVFVKTKTHPYYDDDTVDGDEFIVQRVKYFSTLTDQVVFLKNVFGSRYALDFGTGIRGVHVPNAKVKIKIKVTQGSNGNINRSAKLQLLANKNVYVYDFDKDGNILSGYPMIVPANSFIGVNFEYSDNGNDPLSGDKLRKAIINHIQTRDNFLDEQDFYNIVDKYEKDFKFVFKKTSFLDNIFYLYRIFRDRYQNVVRTTSSSQRVLDYSDTDNIPQNINSSVVVDMNMTTTKLGDSTTRFDITNPSGNVFRYTYDGVGTDPKITSDNPNVGSTIYIDSPDFNSNNCGTFVVVGSGENYFEIENVNGVVESDKIISTGSLLYSNSVVPGNYYYKIVASDNFGYTLSTDNIVVNVVSPGLYNSIQITWDAVPDANCYYVYGRDELNKDRYWVVYQNSFSDLGKDSDNTSIETSGIPAAGPFDYVYYPKFYSADLISPFLYKYNSYFNWYEGYLLYTDLIVYFNSRTIDNNKQSLPNFHLNIVYDILRNKTILYLKSAEKINKYNIKITVDTITDTQTTNTVINQQNMNIVDENTFRYDYIDSNTQGLFWDEFSVSVEVFDGQLITASGPGFIFANGSNEVSCQGNNDDFNKVSVGDYIFRYSDTIDCAQKVISKDVVSKIIYLENNYTGSSGTDTIIRKTDLSRNGQLLAKSAKQVYNIKDQLTLYVFKHQGVDYVTNIPSIDYSVFEQDPEYYLQKMYNFMIESQFNELRLPSDNIQCRFLNTYDIPQEYLSLVTKQGYDSFTLKFPLKLQITVLVDKNIFESNNLSTLEEKDNIRLEVATYLQQNQTGSDISLYSSQIEDIVHNGRSYVKSVSVKVSDSDSSGNHILDQGIESNSSSDVINGFANTPGRKLEIVRYTPNYFWWNIDNVEDDVNLNGIVIDFVIN